MFFGKKNESPVNTPMNWVDRNHTEGKHKNSLQNAKILITGGTGTFGNAFLDRCLEQGAAEVRILSRDEKKQYDI